MKAPSAKYPSGLAKTTLLALVALLALIQPACDDKGEEEPHPALIYNICDIAEAADGSTLFRLYRPDADEPVLLSAPGFSAVGKDGSLPSPGTSGLLGYYPADGEAYKDGEIAVTYWAAINNFPLVIPAEAEAADYLADWDAEGVQYLAGWRGGGKLYLRLRLPYSSIPRRFGLVADPATLSDPLPTLYLCHERREESPTFDRQYYFAFDVSELWRETSVAGVRLMVNDNLSGRVREFTFHKNL